MTKEKLFGRRYVLQIRDILIKDSLRISFKVEKHLKPDPNTIELRVYNLKEEHRKSLQNLPESRGTLEEKAKNPGNHNMVRLEVGYDSGTTTVYLGEVRYTNSIQDGSDIVTILTSGDGEKEAQLTRIAIPVGAKTSRDTVLRQIVKALGCGHGNLEQAIQRLNKGAVYPLGGALYGSAMDELDAFCKAAQLDYSIQDGKLLLLDKGRALAGEALVLEASSGLIGSPTVDSNGSVSARTLMLPDVFPGRQVQFRAKGLTGAYRVEECTYIGDTHGPEWYIELKCNVHVKTTKSS